MPVMAAALAWVYRHAEVADRRERAGKIVLKLTDPSTGCRADRKPLSRKSEV